MSFFVLAFNKFPGKSLDSQVTTTGEVNVGRVNLITEMRENIEDFSAVITHLNGRFVPFSESGCSIFSFASAVVLVFMIDGIRMSEFEFGVLSIIMECCRR